MSRRALLAITPWPVIGASASAPRRMLSYLQERARDEDITIVALSAPGSAAESLGDQAFGEIRIPMTRGHDLVRKEVVARWGPPADLLALESASWLTPSFRREIERRGRDSTVLVTVPALAADVRRVLDRPPHVLCDRSEYLARRDAYGEETPVLQRIAQFEESALSAASEIIVPTVRDGKLIAALYRKTLGPFSVVAPLIHGVAGRCVPVFGSERRARKAGSTLAGTPVAALAATDDPANIVLVQRIIALAPALPNVLFLVVGSVGVYFDRSPVLPNVKFTGQVDDSDFDQIMQIVDVGLDPAPDGAARGVRVLDYARRGVPIVATSHAARLLPEFSALVVPFANMPAAISRLTTDDAAADVIASAAYQNCKFGVPA